MQKQKPIQKLTNLTYWSLFLIIALVACGGLINQIEAYDGTRNERSNFILSRELQVAQKVGEKTKIEDGTLAKQVNETSGNHLCSLDAVICEDEKQGTIESLIAHYSDIYNFNLDTALRIADCESKTGKYLYNFSGSSAKGIYQFTDATWRNYCKGDVLNADDNIKCFMQLYNKHPQWWECV